MCGIFGIINKKESNLGEILIEACKRLSYRGYDSVGCATIDEDFKIDLRKDVGKVEEVAKKLSFAEMKGFAGMAQLRWATFGAPSQTNAQPHFDSEKDLVGAHNGNVVNNIQLREMFIKEGMAVRSTNDGESCVHSVEFFMKKGHKTEDAVRKATPLLEGDYASLVAKKGEKRIYAVKKGSGLVVGVGEEGNYVSSDLPSLLFLTRKIIRVEDGEMVILEPDKVIIKKIDSGEIVKKEIEEITEEMESAKKGGFPHFMIKEIYEQPKVSMDLLHLLNASPMVEKFINKINNARNVYFIGCGTSYHACLFGSVAFAQNAKKPAIPVLAPQFVPQYLPTVDERDVGIFVSQSGETKDVLRAVEFAKEKKMQVLGIVNVLGSTLMKLSDVYLPLACGYEISVPATKTFTNQALIFLYLSVKMASGDCKNLMDFPKALE
ncbi:MAG: SIS domain-containing protein [Acidobacteria bacterium]|nr:SIS domain-containing protein [Acidobacteriota bacterium]